MFYNKIPTEHWEILELMKCVFTIQYTVLLANISILKNTFITTRLKIGNIDLGPLENNERIKKYAYNTKKISICNLTSVTYDVVKGLEQSFLNEQEHILIPKKSKVKI